MLVCADHAVACGDGGLHPEGVGRGRRLDPRFSLFMLMLTCWRIAMIPWPSVIREEIAKVEDAIAIVHATPPSEVVGGVEHVRGEVDTLSVALACVAHVGGARWRALRARWGALRRDARRWR